MTTLCVIVCQVVQSVTSTEQLSSEPLHLHHHHQQFPSLQSLHSPPLHQLSSSALQPDPALLSAGPSSLEIVTAVTCSVGIIQALIGLLRLGSLTLVINDVIISSFTTGASLHVATSQVRHVLGLAKLTGVSGPGRLVQTYLAIGKDFSHLSAQLTRSHCRRENPECQPGDSDCLCLLSPGPPLLRPGPLRQD